FARADCRPCPSRDKCTTAAKGRRMLTLRPRELHETVAAARAEQKTDTWQAKYTLRAGVEGTINQALDVTGLRRARYRGLPKTSLQHAYSATAINVIRLDPTGPKTPGIPGPVDSPGSPTNSQPDHRPKFGNRVSHAVKVR
ncbi:transposase, partial [Saccharothrix sp. ST-888]|uniref:transposase n=1 Tax=Saccharothrix sp. ST-888 TaxID=1427391 RepID=UPI000B2258F7